MWTWNSLNSTSSLFTDSCKLNCWDSVNLQLSFWGRKYEPEQCHSLQGDCILFWDHPTAWVNAGAMASHSCPSASHFHPQQQQQLFPAVLYWIFAPRDARGCFFLLLLLLLCLLKGNDNKPERNLSGTQASFWRPRGSSQITPWILWFMCAGEYMQTKCCWAYLLWWRWQYRKDFLKSVCVEEVLKQLLLVWKKKYVHLGCMDKQLVLSREELGNLELFAESWVRLDVGGQTSWFPSRGILCSCFSLVNSQEIVVLAGGKATVERSMCYGSEERVMLIYLSPLLIAVPVNRTKCLFILGFLRDICTLHDPVFDERGVTQLLWNEIFAQGRMLIYLKSLNQLWLCSVRDF